MPTPGKNTINKVLILGASGFIGRNLSQFLLGKGYPVYGIGHKNDDSELPPSHFLDSEITEEAIQKFCPDPGVVINCAGGGSVADSFKYPYADFKKSTEPLFAGLEYIRKNKLDCSFIQTSSAAVYGNQQGLLTEDAATDRQVSPYGVYKKACEQICLMYHYQFGVTVSILRLFSVYGPGLKKQLLWDACNKICRGEHSYYGTGSEIRDWVHINDICRLYAGTIELNRSGLLLTNGGSGNGTKVSEVLELVYRGLCSIDKPIFLQSSRQGDPHVFIADTTYAKSIGWQSEINPQQGIQEYIDWFKSDHRI